MHKSVPERIFLDWYGVLGMKGLWYKSSKRDARLAMLSNYLFSDHDRFHSWMRGERHFSELVQSAGVSLNEGEARRAMLEDWNDSEVVNTALLHSIKRRFPDTQCCLLTDNVDIFTQFLSAHTDLTSNFTHIFNSSDYGRMKYDEPGLFEVVLDELQIPSFSNCVLFDDNAGNCERFRKLGGEAYVVTEGRV